jgi:hypothetical protein
MTAYRKKPVTIDATQWFKKGDHPEVTGGVVAEEGESDPKCKHCGQVLLAHGWIKTLEGGHIVCPGDWIITGVKGEHYPCKSDIFAATYEDAL